MNKKASKSVRGASDDRIPVSEWTVSGMGLLLVLGSLVFLLYKAVLVDPIPPSFEAQFVSATPSANGFLTKIKVYNRGGESVADLVVLGRQQLSTDDEAVREVNLDYLPAHSSREIYLLLPELPDDHTLGFTFASFKEP